MQSVTKKFQERTEIINKIQFNLRKKNFSRSGNAQSHHTEFPPIVNSFGSPSKRKKTEQNNRESRPSSRTIFQNQYDYLITDTISNYKDQQINKIIFTNPLANRTKMRLTYYRPNHSSTLDSKSGNHLLLPKEGNNEKKEELLLSFSPVKLQSRKKFGTTSLSLKRQSCKRKSNLSMLYNFPQQIEPKLATVRQGNLTMRKAQNTEIKSQRCSPWKYDQTQQQLIS